jgi:hypothetical protein
MSERRTSAGCSGANPVGIRFCGRCGRPSPGGGGDGDTHPDQGDGHRGTAPGDGAVRRISGFTTLAEQLDAERLHEIFAPIVSRLAAVAERYGGFVAKFAGGRRA